jgi:putative PIN family toxin of toxin-antitoxin system
MKVFFDTNVYVAEALLGEVAGDLIRATEKAGWRVYVSNDVLDELQRVLAERLGFARRLAVVAKQRVARRAMWIEPRASRHVVPNDPGDNSILRAALEANVDYLVTNDEHLLKLHPYEGLQIAALSEYRRLLINEGWLTE